MKILFVVPGGQDLGGIITSTEQYVLGLREEGHSVTFMTAAFTKGRAGISTPRGKFASDFTKGPGTGELYHPTQGWRGEPRLSLMNAEDRAVFIAMGKRHDLIIWASMYGFRNPATEGSAEWAEIFAPLRKKHIFMIHDDHIRDRYPWAFALAKYARAYVGVQPCSYDSLEGVAAPRGMVFTPLPKPPRRIEPVDSRRGYLMCQIWKGWKNGDKLVAAAPYMPKGSVTFAGDGIQLRYLRSKDKCPPRFAGLWDAAMKKGSHYVGILSEPERDAYLRRYKFLVDLSLRHNSGQLNRIVQEAMAQGCVVIADSRFITGTTKHPVFHPGTHYLDIDATLPPKILATRLAELDKIDPWEYTRIQAAARKTLGLFDRVALARDLVKPFPKDPTDKDLLEHGKSEFHNIFGEEP